MCGTERLTPGRVGDQRHQCAVGAAHRWTDDPFVLGCRIHRIAHEAIRAGSDARPAIVGWTVEADGRAEGATRNFKCADQAGQQRARPTAFVAAPAIVDGLAEYNRHRSVGQGDFLNLDCFADSGMSNELVGDPSYSCRWDLTDWCRPFRRILLGK